MSLPALWEHRCQPGQAERSLPPPAPAPLLPLATIVLTTEVTAGAPEAPNTHSLDFLKPPDGNREDGGFLLVLAVQVHAFSLPKPSCSGASPLALGS